MNGSAQTPTLWSVLPGNAPQPRGRENPQGHRHVSPIKTHEMVHLFKYLLSNWVFHAILVHTDLWRRLLCEGQIIEHT